MKKFFSWVWQFPQNLIGYLFTRSCYMKSYRVIYGKQVDVWYKPLCRSGVSLGDYIILDVWYAGKTEKTMQAVRHEYGHQRQSLLLGWLYLPLVGLPSICRNIWDRLFHRGWNATRRNWWYYNGYPEKWADKLGGIYRS